MDFELVTKARFTPWDQRQLHHDVPRLSHLFVVTQLMTESILRHSVPESGCPTGFLSTLKSSTNSRRHIPRIYFYYKGVLGDWKSEQTDWFRLLQCNVNCSHQSTSSPVDDHPATLFYSKPDFCADLQPTWRAAATETLLCVAHVRNNCYTPHVSFSSCRVWWLVNAKLFPSFRFLLGYSQYSLDRRDRK